MSTFRIGQRGMFTDGQFGRIVAVYNGGAYALFASDTGARFTIRPEEFRPCVSVSREGYPVIARGIDEDNSGCTVAMPDGTYQNRYAYPIGCAADPVTGEDGAAIYHESFTSRDAAVAALRSGIGQQ